jgi:hypothetical protein
MIVTHGTARLNPAARAEMLRAGFWQRSDNGLVALADMPDGYLVNAYLKALGQGDAAEIVEPLAREVVRRGLRDAALQAAAAREQTQPREQTHWVPYDSPGNPRKPRVALCGARGMHSNAPTCLDCRTVLAEREREEP